MKTGYERILHKMQKVVTVAEWVAQLLCTILYLDFYPFLSHISFCRKDRFYWILLAVLLEMCLLRFGPNLSPRPPRWDRTWCPLALSGDTATELRLAPGQRTRKTPSNKTLGSQIVKRWSLCQCSSGLSTYISIYVIYSIQQNARL